MPAASLNKLNHIFATIAEGVRSDTRLRWGLGAGASVLLSAGLLGMGGGLTPALSHASISPHAQVSQSLEVVDMSTSTVYEVIEQLPKAERFSLMLYNSGADQVLETRGTYTVFVPASAEFDYLPRGYIAGLSRDDMYKLARAHMVGQALPIEESLNGDVPTLGDTAIKFNVNAADQTISVNDAKVLKAYKASNGMVYLINKVLVPQGN
jgi:uncharacterized surface protein with fasciclin (FAS1) repeats